uniref:Uncharacterized protein n=1 Tax=Timema shepardi TaxID=629360 RepID=A0A7R9B8H4_TIMSH|nr:unnamed protein product [Timema shepardi]
MGSSASVEQEEQDSFWQYDGGTQNQHDIQNVLDQETQQESNLSKGQNSPEDSSIAPGQESTETDTREHAQTRTNSWQKREQDLIRTIQHLAEENMKLTISKRELETHLSDLELVRQDELETVRDLKTETERNKKEIQELTLQVLSEQANRQETIKQTQQARLELCEDRDKLFQQVENLTIERENHFKEMEKLKEQLYMKNETLVKSTLHLKQEKELGKYLSIEVEKLKDETRELKAALLKLGENPQELKFENDGIQQASSSQVTNSSCQVTKRDVRVAEEIERFKAEMSIKREARQRAISAVSSEMERLRSELNSEREARQHVVEEYEKLRKQLDLRTNGDHNNQNLYDERERNRQLVSRNENLLCKIKDFEETLTSKNKEIDELKKQMEVKYEQSHKQILALKDVVSVSKQMLAIREGQVTQLEGKLQDIETSFSHKSEAPHDGERVNTARNEVITNLKLEYQTQIENMKTLKSLYEERMTIVNGEKEKLDQERKEMSERLEAELDKREELESAMEELKSDFARRADLISSLQTRLDMAKDETEAVSKELALINSLFTQMLVSSSTADIDLDKLTRLLQENHNLISEMTMKEEGKETAACLPKLLLDLIVEVDNNSNAIDSLPSEDLDKATDVEETTTEEQKENKQRPCSSCEENGKGEDCIHNLAAEDIASNLPKVWKVLTELLSHHVTPTERPSEDSKDVCYKSVDTPFGPRLVISVSKTYLRLKDLILEKKSLRKELTKLKQLNGHLEIKLTEQEERLALVSSELHKTWSVVGRMRTQHQQLHTHEKILRYELQEKRKMLTELKQELEYCREKWEKAREKNTQSEADWRKLRKEFAARKTQPSGSINNSGESGFSDDKEGDSSGEDNCAGKTSKDPVDPTSLTVDETTKSDLQSSSPTQFYIADVSSEMRNSNFTAQTESVISEQPTLPLEPYISPSEPTSSDSCSSLYPHIPPLVTDANQTEVPLSNDIAEDVCQLNSPGSETLSSFNNSGATVQSSIQVVYPVEGYCSLECSTISLLSLLKQQLSYFSKNLEQITSDFNSEDKVQALQSIFFLPDIKVPFRAEELVLDDNPSNNDMTCANCLKEIPNKDKTKKQNETECSKNKTAAPTQASRQQRVLHCNKLTPNKETSEVIISSDDSKTVSEDITVSEAKPSTSGATPENKTVDRLGRTPEQALAAREARLKRLEEQCQQLVKKVTKTTHRSVALSNRLEELHEHYGNGDDGIDSSSFQTNGTVARNASSASTSDSPLVEGGTVLGDTETDVRNNPQDYGVDERSSLRIPMPPPFLQTLPIFRIPVESTTSLEQSTVIEVTAECDESTIPRNSDTNILQIHSPPDVHDKQNDR